ncbi:MAG TPA: hypothetical protein VFL12_11245 [Thermoanaerobaculia bacterium]|nr:hypothetical protein [Thermoanaerobaculia bacterium]
MRRHRLTTPQIGFLIATRAALAAGAGLLLSGKLSPSVRQRLGAALVAFGALTTLPAARLMFKR